MVKPHIYSLLAAFFLASGLAAAEVKLGPELPASEQLDVGEVQVDPQIARGVGGIFAVWSDKGRYEVLAAFNGVSMTIDHTDGNDYIGWPAIAAGGRVFLVVWRHNIDKGKDQILARRFDFSGHPVDAQPLIFDESARATYQWFHAPPAIAFDGSTFLVAWSRAFSESSTASSANLQTIRIGEEGPAFGARQTPAALGFDNYGPRSVRALWTGAEFVVTYTRNHTGHAGGPYSYDEIGIARFDRNNTVLSQTPSPWMFGKYLSPAGVATTLAGSRVTFAWVENDNNISVAQTKIGGEVALAPRVIVRRAPAAQSVANIAWNGSEHVLVWLEPLSGQNDVVTLRAIRLDAELKPIDAEPFDISSEAGPFSPPWLISTPAGVTIAYSRNNAANGGVGRIFTRTLDALSPGSLPDLALNSPITATPNPVTAGEVVTVKYQIRNLGGGAAGATTTRIDIRRDFDNALVMTQEFPTNRIAAGSVVDEALPVTISIGAATGAYTVYVTLDRLGEIAQSSTANDSGTAPLNVKAVPNCEYTLDRREVILPGAGGSGSIELTASDQACRWTVDKERSGEWLTITSGNGTGNGVIAFIASPNSSSVPRSIILMVGNVSAVVRQGPQASHRRSVGH